MSSANHSTPAHALTPQDADESRALELLEAYADARGLDVADVAHQLETGRIAPDAVFPVLRYELAFEKVTERADGEDVEWDFPLAA